MYMEYVSHLHSEGESRPQSQFSAQTTAQPVQSPATVKTNSYEDQEDDSQYTGESGSTQADSGKKQLPADAEMINISGCEFDEFAAYMSKQFGEG